MAITGTGPYDITIPAGTYPTGVNLTFTPNAVATNGTITFNHNGGGAGFGSGSDPGPFTYSVSITTPALCASPIEFTDTDTGQLTVVPIGALSFSNGGLIVADSYISIDGLQSWLNYLAATNVIQPAPTTT